MITTRNTMTIITTTAWMQEVEQCMEQLPEMDCPTC